MHNMRAVSLSFIQGLTEDYSPGDSLSVALREQLQRGRGEASLYMNFFGLEIHAVKHTSWWKIMLITNISQVNDFSAFLCMGRCKKLGSLKFFLRYMSNYLRTCLPKAQSASSCFSSWIPLRVQLVGNCSGLWLNPCRTGWWTMLFIFLHSHCR